MQTRARLLIIALGVFLVAGSCGGGSGESATVTTAQVSITAETECRDAPGPGDVGSNPSAYPDLTRALLLSMVCGGYGGIRQLWPSGIAQAEVLDYAERVCGAGFNTPPAPQEWYEEHDGPSSSVDDFAIAIANQIQIDGVC